MGKSGYSLQWVHLSPYSVKFPEGLRRHLHPMPPSGGRYEGGVEEFQARTLCGEAGYDLRPPLAFTKAEDYLGNSAKQAKVREYERQIDHLVYELYGLTPEEIEIVEGGR